MSSRCSPLLAVVTLAACAGLVTAIAFGCSSDSGTTNGGTDSGSPPDGAADGAALLPDAAAFDAACPKPKLAPATGETCIGFGKGAPCDPACGLPEYGYVCINGGPPGFTGCLQASSTTVGETYCCPANECVPQPDQDKTCKGGLPHRYQCPPDVMPSAGCSDGGSGGTAVERFYCCP